MSEIRLYDVPRGSKIIAEVYKSETKEKRIDTITFDRLDGAYSHCTTSDGYTVHLHATTPLIKDGDVYRLWKPEASKGDSVDE